jgi:hypothetical protein
MGGACSMYEMCVKCRKICWFESMKESDHLEDLGADERII